MSTSADYLGQIMQIAAEISLYPMAAEYDALILDFVARLKEYKDLEIVPGQVSTSVRGEFEAVFKMFRKETEESLASGKKVAIVIKIVNLV